jgi:site-specific DNA-methyltransferase (adenine-specific)
MKVEQRKLSGITPYSNNPRINDHAVDAVARSIEEFGFRQPIVVDEQGVIIVGHTRYKAAVKLALEKVPVHVARGLTPAQIKAVNRRFKTRHSSALQNQPGVISLSSLEPLR